MSQACSRYRVDRSEVTQTRASVRIDIQALVSCAEPRCLP